MMFPLSFTGNKTLRYIFPSKQEDTQKAITLAQAEEKIRRLIVFGSAVTMQCGTGSDLDIAIDAPDISDEEFGKLARKFYLGISSELDLIHYNAIRSPLLKDEIRKKGVIVYAKRE